LLFFILAVIALLHEVPGIHNWLILSQHQFSVDSVLYSKYINYEAPLIGFSICAFGLPLVQSWKEGWNLFKSIAPLILTTMVCLITSSYLLGYIRFDYKLTNIATLWLVMNLLFTCVTEEGLFRGFLQTILCQWFAEVKHGQSIALTITAIIFGLAHYAGGIRYIFLASIAGLFYGYAYLKTKRIEASIFVHFTLNTLHFIFFSYPALSSAFK